MQFLQVFLVAALFIAVCARGEENDDYCDGFNDELTTSACSGQSSAKFTCTGSEYVKQEIFLSRVNDGVCDCCSGADEAGDLVQCPNTCAELEKSEKERIAKEENVRRVGREKKAASIASGKAALQEYRSSIETNSEMDAKYESLIKQLDEEIKDDETLAKLSLDTKVKEAEMVYLNAIRSTFQGVPRAMLSKMISSIIYRGKEEVAEAVLKAAEDKYEGPGESVDDTQVIMLSMETPADSDLTLGLISSEGDIINPTKTQTQHSSDEINGIFDNVLLKEDSLDLMSEALALARLSDDSLLSVVLVAVQQAVEKNVFTLSLLDAQFTSDQTGTEIDRSQLLPKLAEVVNSFPISPVKMRKMAAIPTSKVDQLRSQLDKAKKDKESQAQLMSTSAEVVKLNYGENDFLFSLHGTCPSMNHSGYLYKVCPFRQSHQSQNLLGTYEKFTNENGKIQMHFTNGAHCFANNKPRHMIATLECTDADSPSLSDVIEYEVCSYHSILKTNLAC